MRGFYRNFLLIAAFTASLSHAGWRGGYGMGQVNVANGGKIVFANGSEISGDSGANLIINDGTANRITVAAAGAVSTYSNNGTIKTAVDSSLAVAAGTWVLADTILDAAGTGAPTFSQGLDIATAKSITFANGSTISGDSGADTVLVLGTGQLFEVQEEPAHGGQPIARFDNSYVRTYKQGGATAWTEYRQGSGMILASGEPLTVGGDITFGDAEGSITWDGGASISEDTNDDLNIEAGSDTGDQVRIRESTADGGSIRFLVGDVSTIIYNTTGGALWTWGGNATINSGDLFANGANIQDVEYIELDAITGVGSPDDGHVIIWAPTDASAATDNVLQIEDQAGTAADFTHGAIDIEAP